MDKGEKLQNIEGREVPQAQPPAKRAGVADQVGAALERPRRWRGQAVRNRRRRSADGVARPNHYGGEGARLQRRDGRGGGRKASGSVIP